MNLATIALILENAGVGTRERDIFVNNMPATSTQGIILRPPFGGIPIDYELPGYRKGSFMLIARSPRYQLAEELMTAAMAALTIENSEPVVGMWVNYLRPRTEPLTYPPTPAGLVEFMVNIDACYVIV